MIKAKYVQWCVVCPAALENVREYVVQDAIPAHGKAQVQILQQQGRQLRKWCNGRVRAGDIDGFPHWCSSVDAPPFIPFAAGCCLRGSERGEESEETACLTPAGLDRGNLVTVLRELVPIHG